MTRSLLLLLLLPLAAAGCFDNVGLTIADDLAAEVDASPPPAMDLTVVTTIDLHGCLTSCAGCCDGEGNCHVPPSLATCGLGGKMCVTCDPERADRCEGGHCRCGVNGACGDGFRCTDRGCVCDAKSCPSGCCDDQGCQALAVDHCALQPGELCKVCSNTVADGCKKGCSCGGHDPCALGQRCVNGTCRCDFVSCPTGCCNQSLQCVQHSLGTCTGSSTTNACVVCPLLLSDTCSDKGCVCGTSSAPCQSGQRCSSGHCVCDQQSLCPGCCLNKTLCKPGTSSSLCGAKGATCIACDTATGQTCTAQGACAGMGTVDGGAVGGSDMTSTGGSSDGPPPNPSDGPQAGGPDL